MSLKRQALGFAVPGIAMSCLEWQWQGWGLYRLSPKASQGNDRVLISSAGGVLRACV